MTAIIYVAWKEDFTAPLFNPQQYIHVKLEYYGMTVSLTATKVETLGRDLGQILKYFQYPNYTLKSGQIPKQTLDELDFNPLPYHRLFQLDFSIEEKL